MWTVCSQTLLLSPWNANGRSDPYSLPVNRSCKAIRFLTSLFLNLTIERGSSSILSSRSSILRSYIYHDNNVEVLQKPSNKNNRTLNCLRDSVSESSFWSVYLYSLSSHVEAQNDLLHTEKWTKAKIHKYV